MVLAPELIWVALLIVTIALAWAAAKLINALLGPLAALASDIPKIGGWISGAIDSVARSITNACGAIERGADSIMGSSFHAIARTVETLLSEIKSHAGLFAKTVPFIGLLVAEYHALRGLIRNLHSVSHAVTGQVKRLEKEYNGIEHRVKKIEREIGKGIGHDLRIQIKALEQDVTNLDNKVIPKLRAAVNTAEGEAELALGQVKRIPFPASAKTWAEAVAVAIPALGLSWLECNSNPFKGNKNGCGLWSQLGKLLGLAAFLTIAFDFRQFVEASDEVASFIGKSVAAFEGTFPVALPPLPPPE